MLGRVEEEINTDIPKLFDGHFFVKCEIQQRSFVCRRGNSLREFGHDTTCSAGLCCRVLSPAAVHQEGLHAHGQTFLVATFPGGQTEYHQPPDGPAYLQWFRVNLSKVQGWTESLLQGAVWAAFTARLKNILQE